MIALRQWLCASRSRIRAALVIVAVLGAFVGAHSAGEADPMPSEHSDHSEDELMGMCLAVLVGGAVAGLAAALRRGWRRALRPSVAPWPRISIELASPEAPQGPPPRAGPAALQVFLH